MVFIRTTALQSARHCNPLTLAVLFTLSLTIAVITLLPGAHAAPVPGAEAAPVPITVAALAPTTAAAPAPSSEPAPAEAAPAPIDVWVAVDTEELSLAVMQGDNPLQVFDNIAIGSNGPTLAKTRGDSTTPLGEFTITEIRRSDRFKLFMAINYPNLDHTERAFQDQRINVKEYQALRYALDRGRPPLQSTSLGGQLGIHGVGTGDMKVHETVNWTEGCIAVTNEQLLQLAKWVVVGTKVVVR